jgi:hypothetical protein
VSKRLARTRVGLVIWKEREAVLERSCGGAIGWKCLGNAAGKPWTAIGGKPEWGPVSVALPDASATATGTVVLGAATSSFFGQPDVGLLDIEENPEYGTWLSNLRRGNVDADVARMLAAGNPSIANAAAGLEVAVRPVVAAAASRDKVTVIYPSPVATADVYLGTIGSKRGSRLAEILGGDVGRAALTKAGWTMSNAGLQPVSYLPTPGLLAALRSKWASS